MERKTIRRKQPSSQEMHSCDSRDTSSSSSSKQQVKANRKLSDTASNWKTIRRCRSKRKPYMKISHVNLQRLKILYSKNIYPNKFDFFAYSKELDIPAIKIENWFKHRRRSQINKGITLAPPPLPDSIDQTKPSPKCEIFLKELKESSEIVEIKFKASFRFKTNTDKFEVKSTTLSINQELISQESNGFTNKQDGPYKHLILISGPSCDLLSNQGESELLELQESEEIMQDEQQEKAIPNNKNQKEFAEEKANLNAELFEEERKKNDEEEEENKKKKEVKIAEGHILEMSVDYNQYEDSPEPHRIFFESERIMVNQQRHIEILNEQINILDHELRELAAENEYLKKMMVQDRIGSKGRLYNPAYNNQSTPPYHPQSSYWPSPYVTSYTLAQVNPGPPEGVYDYYYSPPQYYRPVKIIN